MIERRAEWDDGLGGNFAQRRLQSGDAAGGGRDPDRAAGIGTDRCVTHAFQQRDRGPRA